MSDLGTIYVVKTAEELTLVAIVRKLIQPFALQQNRVTPASINLTLMKYQLPAIQITNKLNHERLGSYYQCHA